MVPVHIEKFRTFRSAFRCLDEILKIVREALATAMLKNSTLASLQYFCENLQSGTCLGDFPCHFPFGCKDYCLAQYQCVWLGVQQVACHRRGRSSNEPAQVTTRMQMRGAHDSRGRTLLRAARACGCLQQSERLPDLQMHRRTGEYLLALPGQVHREISDLLGMKEGTVAL